MNDYNTALQKNSDNANAYTNRGRLYCEMRKFRLAIQDFEKAITLGLPRSDLQKWIATAKRQIDQRD